MNHNLKTGDVVLFLKSGLFGSLVGVVQHKYKHAAIVHGDVDGRLCVIESVYYGVALNALDVYDPDSYHVFRFNGDINDRKLRQRLINYLDLKYDYWGLLGASIVAILKLFKIKIKNMLQDAKLPYCSEIPAQVLGLDGINSPNDLALHPHLRRIK